MSSQLEKKLVLKTLLLLIKLELPGMGFSYRWRYYSYCCTSMRCLCKCSCLLSVVVLLESILLINSEICCFCIVTVEKVRWYLKLSWFLYEVSISQAILISLLFWGLRYDSGTLVLYYSGTAKELELKSFDIEKCLNFLGRPT